MPMLPSGRFVGIMSERALFHAKRHRLRVSESTPHNRLYGLIDILIEPPQDASGSGKPYAFSGYTLADSNWIAKWEARDRDFFLNWIREPSQVRLIEQARVRLLVESTLPQERAYPYPGRLYSLLRKRLEALPLPRAAVGQWQRTLLNMKRDGVRREELDRSGAMAFLSTRHRDEMIDKQSLLGAIDYSAIVPHLGIELECAQESHLPFAEVAQRLAPYQLQLAGLGVGDRDLGVVRYACDSPRYRIGMVWPSGHALCAPEQPRWFVLGPYGQAVTHPERRSEMLFASPQQARQVAAIHAQRTHRLRSELKPRARYEYLSLHGGEDYREWLLTLPHYHSSHFTGHFYERNILLHIRSKVRQTVDGQRVLFIEELQSDWHQACARFGVRGGIPRAPYRRDWVSLALKLMLMHVVEKELDGIAWADAAVHELRYGKVLTPLRRLYDEELPGVLERLGRPWNVCVGRGRFDTRRPWLHALRSQDRWKVEGGEGKFATRARYSKDEAMAIITRHSAEVTLELPLLLLSEPMRRHIGEQGLPLFGERHTGFFHYDE